MMQATQQKTFIAMSEYTMTFILHITQYPYDCNQECITKRALMSHYDVINAINDLYVLLSSYEYLFAKGKEIHKKN